MAFLTEKRQKIIKNLIKTYFFQKKCIISNNCLTSLFFCCIIVLSKTVYAQKIKIYHIIIMDCDNKNRKTP